MASHIAANKPKENQQTVRRAGTGSYPQRSVFGCHLYGAMSGGTTTSDSGRRLAGTRVQQAETNEGETIGVVMGIVR